MKWVIGILGLTAAFVGYLSYPSLRYQLTGLSPKAAVKPTAVKDPEVATDATAPQPVTPPAVTPATVAPAALTPPVIDLAKLTPAQLPAQVTLKITTEVADASGLKMKIDPGNRLKLVRLEGDQVVVSPGTSPFEGRVPVSGTDLMEQLEANPPTAATVTTPTPEPQPAAIPAAAPEPVTPTVQPAPTSTDSEFKEPAANPPTTEPAAIQPATEPAAPAQPTAEPASAAATGTVEMMKSHIRGGAIKEFTFGQVLEWNAGADEVVNGESFQTGVVKYKAETIFGVKTIEAKALIQNGSVVRWVWPKSGMEIK
ncbi:MAG: hypothetical protein WCK77_13585 [Verrucomicrobiota bacterium]